jgi:hypothetical protein
METSLANDAALWANTPIRMSGTVKFRMTVSNQLRHPRTDYLMLPFRSLSSLPAIKNARLNVTHDQLTR